MSEKVKIQSGEITYSTTDPAFALAFNVSGQLNSGELNVGDTNPEGAGFITTPDGNNLTITTGAGATLNLSQNSTGALTFNNAQWPTGIITPHPGMFVGVSALNTLEYLPFIVAYNPSNTLTLLQLNTTYPAILPGQSVVSSSVIYLCISEGIWRIINTTSPV